VKKITLLSAIGVLLLTGVVFAAAPTVVFTPQGAVVGNPSTVSIAIDNGSKTLADLDLDSFRLIFDSVELDIYWLVTLPANWFVVPSANKIIINFPHLHWPAGAHLVEVVLGNQGEKAARTFVRYRFDADKGLEAGIYPQPFADDDWNTPHDWTDEIARISAVTGRQHSLTKIFTSWADAAGNYLDLPQFLLQQTQAAGITVVLTWAPYRAGTDHIPIQPEWDNTSIISGQHDVYIRRIADHVKDYGQPIIVRLMHEFNGAYYPWGGPSNNNDPSLFVRAFRHVVDLFRERGAANAEFMWSPNYVADARVTGPARNIHNYWPGNDYVAWIGVSGYNWGPDVRMQAQGWLTFDQIFDSAPFDFFLTTMANHYPDKKVIIAEIGCNNGDALHSKAQWILDAYASMSRRSNIAGVVWLNKTAFHDAAGLEADFRVIQTDFRGARAGDVSPTEETPVDALITSAYAEAVR
jgi:hypothetical protein